MKKYLLTILFLFIALPCLAIDYDDLNSVKEPAYRVGTSNDVETVITSYSIHYTKLYDLQIPRR